MDTGLLLIRVLQEISLRLQLMLVIILVKDLPQLIKIKIIMVVTVQVLIMVLFGSITVICGTLWDYTQVLLNGLVHFIMVGPTFLCLISL